jgi:hypothetical protein
VEQRSLRLLTEPLSEMTEIERGERSDRDSCADKLRLVLHQEECLERVTQGADLAIDKGQEDRRRDKGGGGGGGGYL